MTDGEKKLIAEQIEQIVKEKELESHYRLLEETGRQREYFRAQFRNVIWAIAIVFAIVTGSFFFLFNDSSDEIAQNLKERIDEIALEYQINKVYKARLEEMLKNAVGRARSDLIGEMDLLSDSLAKVNVPRAIAPAMTRIVESLEIDNSVQDALRSLTNVNASIKELSKIDMGHMGFDRSLEGFDLHQGVGSTRRISIPIGFKTKFKSKPKVEAFLQSIDVSNSGNIIVGASVENVTNERFDLVLGTFASGSVYSASVTWIAIGN